MTRDGTPHTIRSDGYNVYMLFGEYGIMFIEKVLDRTLTADILAGALTKERFNLLADRGLV